MLSKSVVGLLLLVSKCGGISTWRATSFTCRKRYETLEMKGYFGGYEVMCVFMGYSEYLIIRLGKYLVYESYA